MGYWATNFIEHDGGKITNIIERDAAIYNTDGFDVEDVKAYMEGNKGSLLGHSGARETETTNS